MHDVCLNTPHAGLEFCASEAREIISTQVDPKDLYFTHVVKVTGMHQLKSYLVETSCNHLERIESKSQEHGEIIDSKSASWIAPYINSLDLNHRKKGNLTLELYCIHWSHTASEDDIQKLCR